MYTIHVYNNITYVITIGFKNTNGFRKSTTLVLLYTFSPSMDYIYF